MDLFEPSTNTGEDHLCMDRPPFAIEISQDSGSRFWNTSLLRFWSGHSVVATRRTAGQPL
jgi:hypothetical protein